MKSVSIRRATNAVDVILTTHPRAWEGELEVEEGHVTDLLYCTFHLRLQNVVDLLHQIPQALDVRVDVVQESIYRDRCDQSITIHHKYDVHECKVKVGVYIAGWSCLYKCVQQMTFYSWQTCPVDHHFEFSLKNLAILWLLREGYVYVSIDVRKKIWTWSDSQTL